MDLKDSLKGVADSWITTGKTVIDVAEANVTELGGVKDLIETENGQARSGIVDASSAEILSDYEGTE